MSFLDQPWCPTSVQVTVLQARGLRAKGKGGTNDAYALMQVGKDKYQTSVVEKSVAPVWKEEAVFELPQHGAGGERATLHVHVLHRALVGPDKLLGQAVINLLQLSEDKTRDKTEWFKLLDKTGKVDKDRGEVLVDIQFLRNNMTASMFDLSAAGKPRSRLGKLKDKVRGKKKELDQVAAPSFKQVLTDSEEEEDDGQSAAGKEEKKKKQKLKTLFSHKSNLQRNMSQSMSVLPAKNSSLSGSLSSGLNVDASEGKKKFKFMKHKRSGSSDSKDPFGQKHSSVDKSNLCINGSHVYCEEPPPRATRVGSSFSLASSGHGSMEDVPESSPPSVDSLPAIRQYTTWEEEEEDLEDGNAKIDRFDEEKERMRREEERDRLEEEEEEERRRNMEKLRKEDEKRIREEEQERLAEEKRRLEEEEQRRNEEKARKEEQERMRRQEELEKAAEEMKRLEEEERERNEEKLREEEERMMHEEKAKEEELERMRRQEAEEQERLAEENRRLAEEEQRRNEEKARKEEQERMRRQEDLERAAEKMKRLEEEERKRNEERLKKEEEERMMNEEKAKKEEQEKMRRQEEDERRRNAEKARREEEEKRRQELERAAEEMKKLEEEERKRNEERLKKEEEERMMNEEKARKEEHERMRRQEAEEQERLAEEKRRREEDERRRNDEKARREEEEKIRKEEELERAAEEHRRMAEERKRNEEKARKEEDERIARREKELRRQEEEERMKREEERVREEEERMRNEEKERKETEERMRRQEEERERLAEEKRRLEEEEKERKKEEERTRRQEELERLALEENRRAEEEERTRMEEKMKQQEEEIRRQEEQLAEEKRLEEEERRIAMARQDEQERMRRQQEQLEEERRNEEEERRKREEERKKMEEASRREVDERVRNEEDERKVVEERNGKEQERKPEEERKRKDKKDMMEERRRREAAESLERIPSTNPFDEDVSHNDDIIPNLSSGSKGSTLDTDTAILESHRVGSKTISVDEKKRPAPQPPCRTQGERPSQGEQDGPTRQLVLMAKQNKDKEMKTASVPPQSRSLPNAKDNTSGTSSAAKHAKRPAPSIPNSEPRTVPASLNPFEDEDDDDDAASTHESTSVSRPPPMSQTSNVAYETKVRSSKARAPAPPAKTLAAIQSTPNNKQNLDHIDTTHEDDQALSNQESLPKECGPKQPAVEEESVKKEVPPPALRRLHPVKPLTSQEQNPVSATERETVGEAQEKTKVKESDAKGPYSMLTKDELISLVVKQESQLQQKDKKIAELEQYIDNLLVRVMEEKPSILMSLKKVA
uniref:trichohyalin n=1 Tax=Doryrhamphus excisus TaxID=161450 RepID=UPI0025AE0BF2|nr:trichohyalin [Doryrhamphus excisus]